MINVSSPCRSLEMFLDEKEIMSGKSHVEFLAAHFEVDEEVMIEMKDDLQRRYPYLFKINPSLFVKKLKFLVSTGYIPKELLEYPYVFYCKISTLNVCI